MPRVVTFSPIVPGPHLEPGGAQLVVQLGVDEVHLPEVGLAGVPATRDRCFTVSPWCASPSTPSPASSGCCPRSAC